MEIIITDKTPNDSRKVANRYTHKCYPVGKIEYYFMCLQIIDEVNKGQAFFFDRCPEAIKRGVCPALEMRAREERENKAIYWSDKTNPDMQCGRIREDTASFRVDKQSASYIRGRYGIQAVKEAAPVAPFKPRAEPEKTDAPKDFSKALAEIVSDELEKSKAPLERLPGETPLAFAKRKKLSA